MTTWNVAVESVSPKKATRSYSTTNSWCPPAVRVRVRSAPGWPAVTNKSSQNGARMPTLASAAPAVAGKLASNAELVKLVAVEDGKVMKPLVQAEAVVYGVP